MDKNVTNKVLIFTDFHNLFVWVLHEREHVWGLLTSPKFVFLLKHSASHTNEEDNNCFEQPRIYLL